MRLSGGDPRRAPDATESCAENMVTMGEYMGTISIKRMFH